MIEKIIIGIVIGFICNKNWVKSLNLSRQMHASGLTVRSNGTRRPIAALKTCFFTGFAGFG